MIAPTQAAWSRARSPAQKRLRQEAILDAAGVLIDEFGVDKVSLSAIARKADLSKANCYRYFENREAIFLELLVKEAQSWTDQLIDQLGKLSGQVSIEQVSEALVNATIERPRMCELTSSLWSVLEQNVSVEVIASFKRRFHELSLAASQALTQRLLALRPDDARQFLTYYLMFVGSAWAAANPSRNIQALFKLVEFENMQMNLRDTLHQHATILLCGLLSLQSSSESIPY